MTITDKVPMPEDKSQLLFWQNHLKYFSDRGDLIKIAECEAEIAKIRKVKNVLD